MLNLLDVRFCNFFQLLYRNLSWSHVTGHKFDILTLVDSGYFFVVFSKFFKISSFNIGLVEN